ncbi:MAG: PQQ-dependent dehydrogenase, methanol/ethanol family [Acidobacteria bacterium]|nr:PQQ-dependent dehydrogenase, methanol/ethanol family [Acidobacteriota bacterium]
MPERTLRILSLLATAVLALAPTPLGQSPSSGGLPITYERLLKATEEPGNWLMYGGDYRSHHYSSLNQITTDNVHRLRVKWIYQMHRPKVETTPIVVDGVMYVTRPPSDVIALDAETGRALWTFEYRLASSVYVCCGQVNRGLAILGTTLFITTLDAKLLALDARSGRMLWKKELADPGLNYTATGAPLVIKDKVIAGIAGAEGGIRGFLDAYDAKTGERLWRFWTVPAPGEPGSETWENDAWKHGGGSTWITGSYDPELNLVYWGTGNPGPDYNGDVRPGDNLFTCSLLALDVDTGKMKWYFQFTPHDTHDWDATQVPVLLDSTFGGRPRKLVVVPSRNGFHYVLDRQTGEFLLAKAYVKQTWAKEIDKKGRPVLNPNQDPTLEGNDTVWPGVDGGNNWMSPSYNPNTKLLYFNAREERRRYFKTDAPEFRPGESFFGGGGGGGARFRPEESWGRFIAMVPETGEIKWEHRILSPPWAGALSTAGNLVFSATPAGNFYALDARTGKELWHFNGGDRVFASPITFLSRGKQLVTIPIGDILIAFGLD